MTVYLVWREKEIITDDGELEEIKELIEVYSKLDRAWDVHKELNEKAEPGTSYSVEVRRVIR